MRQAALRCSIVLKFCAGGADNRTMSNTDNFFGEVISVYTRAQAHADGILLDVSDSEGARLFKFPVSITVALHSALSRGAGNEAATYNARLWDVCYMATVKARTSNESDLFFKVKVGREVLALWGNCGPEDDGAPCMTFGFPEDR